MKHIVQLAAAAAFSLATLAGPALAQDRYNRDRSDRAEHRDDEMRQSPEAARREAVAAYAEAKRECAHERRDERKDCLRSAKEDYDRQMAEARRRH